MSARECLYNEREPIVCMVFVHPEPLACDRVGGICCYLPVRFVCVGGLNTPGANARGVCNGFRQKNGSLDRALSSNGSTPSWCFGGRVFADEVFTADA